MKRALDDIHSEFLTTRPSNYQVHLVYEMQNTAWADGYNAAWARLQKVLKAPTETPIEETSDFINGNVERLRKK